MRAAGFWIVGGKRHISSLIHNCVICRKLCGKREEQKMANLSVDRLSTDPPFTYACLVRGPSLHEKQEEDIVTASAGQSFLRV